MLKKLMLIVVLLLYSFSAVQIATASTWHEVDLDDAIILGIQSSKVYVNGEQGRIDEHNHEIVPFIDNGHTLVPLRFISEKLGAEISWNAGTGEVSLNIDGKTAKVRPGETKLSINNTEITMSTPSRNINGTVYLPLRHVVEDLFGKKIYYKNGIIVISDLEKTISGQTLAELERALKPSVVFTGGLELLYVYADGSSMKQDLGYSDLIKIRGLISVADAEDGHFYIVDNNYADAFINKTSADGATTKTTTIEEHEGLHFLFANEGYMYFKGGEQIVRINSVDTSIRKNVGPGTLRKENTVFQNDEILFTDTSTDYAIYKLQNGKKTKISSSNSFLQFVRDNWIYYTYYDNNRWALYRITKDGNNKMKLSGNADVAHSFLSNNLIYYLDNHTKTLRVMNLDGSNQRVICNLNHSGQEIFLVDGSDIYFTEEDQTKNWTQTLFKANATNGKKQQLVSTTLEFDKVWRRFANVNVLGEFVTYSIHNNVFIVNKDGSGGRKLDTLRTGYMGNLLHLIDR